MNKADKKVAMIFCLPYKVAVEIEKLRKKKGCTRGDVLMGMICKR